MSVELDQKQTDRVGNPTICSACTVHTHSAHPDFHDYNCTITEMRRLHRMESITNKQETWENVPLPAAHVIEMAHRSISSGGAKNTRFSLVEWYATCQNPMAGVPLNYMKPQGLLFGFTKPTVPVHSRACAVWNRPVASRVCWTIVMHNR